MKMFFNSMDQVWAVYKQTKHGLRKVAEFVDVKSAARYMENNG